ncbi:cytochrome c maturation protein CcmE [Hyphomonas pacifica]|uniref:Cytochrome c-type biogenesis protein CcmE n=1 Tax=Hyphomonas pacifica TaxID=1280941 RepID=A0A062TT75_9PROT|nr:cytochrome c maturation protein CcmE [Hyphomonas pacifica]KCZ51181.1 cytochrome C biogenesis protein CcmE [Hyphomonas pacifica]MBR9806537.1 cytochrome c maturation protein CcmE [Alphaproteobacteria bacterium]RAN33660.1 cytochrome C biogenesis protein CcmE [Hyphomonas pacifica]RAN35569.1 cytochrome C biogenesis protein CcmE [Hyphomonas pacifica]|tara:strand:- start:705 stop:1130 length:426 start_codon:yes stop_codon:yes gene_type:complete
MRARTRRLYTFGIAALLLAAAAALAFFALRENANLFYTPEILAEKGTPVHGKEVKVGGWVEPGSLTYSEDGATMIFTVIDNSPNTITVSYTGIAPDLFREGQGVVATGTFQTDGSFTARQILAKHDENYQPRELKPLEAAG